MSAPTPHLFDAPPPTAEDLVDDRFEGAGIASSFHDMGEAVDGQDGLGIVSAGAALALDYVSVVQDPVATLGSAVAGWAMEHIEVLREVLDVLCGDGRQIGERADGWARLSRHLEGRAEELDRAITDVPAVWTGAAAGAYLAAATQQVTTLRELAGDTRELAGLVLDSGVLVGTERALIRDAIADFLGSILSRIVLATAVTVATAGAGAVTVPAVVLEIVRFARTLVARLEEILRMLEDAAGTATRIGQSLQTRSPSNAVRSSRAESAGAVALDAVVESQKQQASARGTVAEWDGPVPTAPAG
ncbi:PPE domain-containing protein [Pseudonocardia alni]|uniref:PPE domain-containing protein n=1 Tax=Pseudonocardia alni TaxID=33907 RepID=UPI00280A6AB1|nr:hypothetical protein [Pseudonocardia alni]